tara:strand:+ start:373 stop:1125 length:753 start_codon:yes stop_codon:yes gene_type:complete
MKRVSIVGAGPGALDLLTQRAIKRLNDADVLIWTDSLISPQIIELSPNYCIKIPTSSLTLEDILPLLIKYCKENKKVVRLHDGDPCLYSALSEQINGIKEAGLEVEVIPGISAYQATAAKLKAELTVPGITQTIVLSRANGRTDMPEKENLEKLAATGASLCLYLSARHVINVEKTLLKFYPEETPVAIGYRVSWDDEWLEVVPLKQMAARSKEKNLIRTTIYIISPALSKNQQRSKLYSSYHKHLFRPS